MLELSKKRDKLPLASQPCQFKAEEQIVFRLGGNENVSHCLIAAKRKHETK